MGDGKLIGGESAGFIKYNGSWIFESFDITAAFDENATFRGGANPCKETQRNA